MRLRTIHALGVFALCIGGAARADVVADFYSGKQISVNIGFSAGGGFDAYARAVARHLGRNIPGTPTLVPRQMPGGGSFRAAQYMYAAAPQDGTQLATIGQSIALQQAMRDPNAKFDVREFSWIGNPINGVSAIGFWSESGARTLDDLKKREFTVGATGHNVTMQYPLALKEIFGAKLKIVLGYPGGNDISMAMERRELDGMGQFSWSSLKVTKKDWLDGRKVNLIVQVGSRKEPEISQYMGYEVPLLTELATNDDDRAVLELLSSGEVFGRPLLTTPKVPADRVLALRAAFDKTMKDPEFLAEANKLGLEVDPVSGVELQKMAERIISATPAVIDRLQKIVQPDSGASAKPNK
jgi:tripartite-type tricarboxylate transporter receptor subunit TctC